MKHFIDTLSVNLLGNNRKPEPIVTQGSVMFLSDGSGGLLLDHLYIKTTSGIFDLSAASAGSITGGLNTNVYNEVYKGVSGSLLEFRTIKAGSNVSIVQNSDYLEISAGVPGYETLLSSSLLISDVENTEIIIDTLGTVSGSIPNGSIIGQKKNVFISNILSSGTLLLSATLSNGSLFTFDTKGQSVLLIWNSLGSWSMLSGNVLLS